jgi:transcriptional regulator with XRE-family HTH domain
MILLRRVIGDALRARRQAQHRTLREVSTAANVSLGYLSEIERGQKEASSELLAAVCDALGARLSELLHEVSSTVASTEGHEGTNPSQRHESGSSATRDESGMGMGKPDESGAVALVGSRDGDQPRGAAEHRAPADGRDAAERREPATAQAASAAAEPVALAGRATGSRPADRAEAPVRASVATLMDGEVSVTVRRETPLSTTLRTRTIRRDLLSRV